MGIKEEVLEIIEDFFETTCITQYILYNKTNNFFQIQKRTPIGSWKIKTVELGYFINKQEQIVIGILSEGTDELHKLVRTILKERAEKIES